MLEGWNPSDFIEGPLSQLVRQHYTARGLTLAELNQSRIPDACLKRVEVELTYEGGSYALIFEKGPRGRTDVKLNVLSQPSSVPALEGIEKKLEELDDIPVPLVPVFAKKGSEPAVRKVDELSALAYKGSYRGEFSQQTVARYLQGAENNFALGDITLRFKGYIPHERDENPGFPHTKLGTPSCMW